jgi:CBS-domain-containing membrane protein
MRPPIKPLFEMTAADLMSRELVLIPRKMSLQGAAHRLAQAEISGAPVVDEFGRCVGVLSAMDLVNFLDQGERAAKRRACECYQVYSPWQMVEVELLPVDEVERFMTADVVTASPDARIADLARAMLDAHIHRIVIVDEACRPIGLVTGTDILGALSACQQREVLARSL